MRKSFGDIFLDDASQMAKEIDLAVNCFGFSNKEQWESVLQAGTERDALDFAIAWVTFQAKEAETKRYDGRNALSCHLAQRLHALCALETLREGVEKRKKNDEVVKSLFDLHRTLKQTLSGFCFFVLDQMSSRVDALNAAIERLCEEPLRYYAERDFDMRSHVMHRSSWHRVPFI